MPNWVARVLMGAAVGAAFAIAVSLVTGVGGPDAVIQAQETEESSEPKVSDEELDLYIDVYRAMQADRSLQIADAVADRGVSVEAFRAIERKVQMQERLIKRVREALLEQAKENATSLAETGAVRR